ncbi:uncharacterized protein N7525_006677 [Penicillium rubens]|nr:uncharacterized protein N7525_006677 [Penicillium rubens]KAJ5828424.1 hypothetical protein N7525_006677 [Penicillium rubens]
MFLFGTLRRPTYESDFVKQSTWKLYGTLQGATQYRPHFEGQIVGLNAAWSLTQGFVNKGFPINEPKEPYPLADGEFVSRAPRMLLDPGDPLGSYLCSSCYFYRRNYGKLPDEAFAKLHRAKRYYQRWIENEREHKRDIFCKGCNKVEAPGASRHTRFVMSHSDPSQFYCKQCWKSSRYESKYKAQEAVCRNPYCGARPGNRTLTGRTVPRLVKGLCLPCGLYMKDNAKKAKESNNADKADDANEAADDFFIERSSVSLRKLRRGDRPPLGPGEIGPNNARNRALKKRRRQAQAAREQAVSYTIYLSKIESGTNKKKKKAVVEARRRELENEFALDMVRARANARLAEEFGPEAARGGGALAHGGNFRGGAFRGGAFRGRGRGSRGTGGRGGARGGRGRGGARGGRGRGAGRGAFHGAEADPGQREAPAAGGPLPDADEDEHMLVDEARAVPNEGAAQNDACARRGPVPQYEQEHRRA